MTRLDSSSKGLALLLGFAAVLGGGVLAALPQDDTFLETVQVNVVNVEVYVTDKEGYPVAGLGPSDFVLREDGDKVEVTNFFWVPGLFDEPDPAAAPAPTQNVLLLFDDVVIDPVSRRRAVAELRSFIDADRRAGVAYGVASYDGALTVRQEFTDDNAAVLAALDAAGELNPAGLVRRAQYEAVEREGRELLRDVRKIQADRVAGSEFTGEVESYIKQVEIYAERLRQVDSYRFLAMGRLANALAGLRGRKVVIWISEGVAARPGADLYEAVASLSGSSRGQRFAEQGNPRSGMSDAALRARSGSLDAIESRGGRRARRGVEVHGDIPSVTALANAANVSFYAYKPLGRNVDFAAETAGTSDTLASTPLDSVRESNLADTLRMLAHETGGAAMVGGDVRGLVARARADSGGYYSLGFSPDHSGDGKERTLKVKAKKKGVGVRHRSSYIDKPLTAKIVDRTTSALLLGTVDNPVGMRIELGEARQAEDDEHWLVTLKVEVPLAGLTLLPQGDLRTLDAQLFVAARSPEGELAPVQEVGLRLEVPAAEWEAAASEVYTAEVELGLREGPQRLAVGFVDSNAETTSFVSREVVVGQAQ